MNNHKKSPITLRNICWPVLIFIGFYHLFLLIAVPLYFMHHTPSFTLTALTGTLVFVSGLAITMGYHRLYSHSTFKTHKAVETILLFFASLATQGSALRWANDHRLHHAFVDTENDPYSVKKGLLHSHILWMFSKSKDIDPKVIADLKRNKLLMFQHKYYIPCMLAANCIAFLFVGWITKDLWGAFLFAWWVRLFCLHHTTWCINSLAHYWGSQHYSNEHTAVDNYLISLLTYGEGYHNYHHTFANDYRNGIYWYHFDPAKWLIWILHKCKLAHQLKRVDNDRIARTLIQREKDQILEKITLSISHQKDAITLKISNLYQQLSEKIARKQELLLNYKAGHKELLREIRAMKKSIKKDWKEWKSYIKSLYNSPELTPNTIYRK